VRTGYSAVADEWIPIRPGTDGALLLALNHELLRQGLYDRDFIAQYSNAGYLVNLDESSDQFGMIVCDEQAEEKNPHRKHQQLWWDRHSNRAVINHTAGSDPALTGSYRLPDWRPRTGTTPQVGLCPCTPQKCAGIRIEPLLSLPTSSALKPTASAVAEPPEDPPGERAESHGLTVAP